MQGRYAVISKARMQVGAFTDYLESINPQFNYIVDLSDHLQAKEVQEDWFYDSVTGVFSAEGEIPYPELEQQNSILSEDQTLALETAINVDYLVSLHEMGI